MQAQNSHLRINDVYVKCGFLTKDIAYLSQESFIPPSLLVRELIPLKKIEDEYIIYKLKDKKIGDLSGGELKIVECFWVFSLKATYILLDEPFKGLSPISIEVIQNLIRRFKNEKGIIITDHTYQPLLEIADRLVLMHNNAVYNVNSLEDLVLYKYLTTI